MKGISIGTALLVLSGCMACLPQTTGAAWGGVPPSGALSPLATPRALVGDQAVAQIAGWYNDTRDNCGSATAPAFVCSGVMLRATETNASFFPWNPNPSSNGVSFSWIRRDTNFSNLVYTYANGFIFYPKSVGVAGSNVIDVKCAFPHDGGTNDRPTDGGCGPSTPYPQASRACDKQNITTASAWLTHFNKQSNKYTGQCGWSMTSSTSAAWFKQFILARQGMDTASWAVQDELRMAKWAQNAAVPIRAFFYLTGKTGALAKAQNDQQRYKNSFGQFVPIVRLTLPSSKQGVASFGYAASDQGVSDPGTPGDSACQAPPGAFTFDTGTQQGTNFTLTPQFPNTSFSNPSLKTTQSANDCPLSGRYIQVDASAKVLISQFVDKMRSVSFDYVMSPGVDAEVSVNVNGVFIPVDLSASSHHFEYRAPDGKYAGAMLFLLEGNGTLSIDNVMFEREAK